MRAIGLILFALGVVLYAIYPRFVGVNTGQTIATARAYDGELNRWNDFSVNLSPAQNPLRLRVSVETFPDKERTVQFFDLRAKVMDSTDKMLANETFTLRRDDGAGNDPANPVSTAHALVEFNVKKSGAYTVELGQKRNQPLNIKTVMVEVIAGGSAINTLAPRIGMGLMLVGGLIFLYSLYHNARREEGAKDGPAVTPSATSPTTSTANPRTIAPSQPVPSKKTGTGIWDEAPEKSTHKPASGRGGSIWDGAAEDKAATTAKPGSAIPEETTKKGKSGSIWDSPQRAENKADKPDDQPDKPSGKKGSIW